jgi:hypothetical protein
MAEKYKRAWNKETLLEMAEINLNKLLDFISELPEDIKNKIFDNDEINKRDKSVSDLICHLHKCHLEWADWYTTFIVDGKMMPTEIYSQQLIEMNGVIQWIWRKNKEIPLKEAISQLKRSHDELIKFIENHSNEVLYESGKYEYTGKYLLGIIFDENLSCRYQRALNALKPLEKIQSHTAGVAGKPGVPPEISLHDMSKDKEGQ